jgi:hypothetical protein
VLVDLEHVTYQKVDAMAVPHQQRGFADAADVLVELEHELGISQVGDHIILPWGGKARPITDPCYSRFMELLEIRKHNQHSKLAILQIILKLIAKHPNK